MINSKHLLKGFEIPLSILFLGGAAAAFAYTGTFPGPAAIFPRLVTGFGVVLSTILVIKALKHTQISEPFFINFSRFLIASGMMSVYLLGINFLGYFTSTSIFVPLLAIALGYKNILYITVITTTFITLIYLIFIYIFRTTLPEELIFSL